MKSIVLTGGGTAGHIMPNIALLPSLKEYFSNIYYIGEKGKMEEKIAEKEGLPFYSAQSIKLVRGKILTNLRIPFVMAKGIKAAKLILSKLKPDVVFSKGGYCALPTVFAARSLKIPVVCHESDMTIGLANRISMPFCAAFITSFPKTSEKGICLGMPVRQRIFEGNPQIVRNLFRIQRPIILFLGGSLGAKAINDCLEKTLSALGDYNILHIKGEKSLRHQENYFAIDFVDNIEDYFAASDLIVCRAGASTLAELTALGKKVLAIPLPEGASRGDQVDNAAYYKKLGLINVLPQEKLTPYNLMSFISDAVFSPSPQKVYDKKTPEKIVQEIVSHCR
ncbi:MAG: UDP-N-acetylglucosamine--N-acetylmuramyl-(pentapeptide) pyrophosphoryl-undecaprenol N-acetylglucosamine transferase [Clostridia bacterium]|nr:UDP-N-acetylglucosamine--N-acetylmuramyl-(pentapeptide) pyrophosphoryl-undecaprenol N-acetylglucosamine transferase [Clostridia bacterium]